MTHIDGFCTANPPGSAHFANDNRAPGRGTAPTGTSGLALACVTNSRGEKLAQVCPVFEDGTLGAPLYIARDGVDIIALWRRLGEEMRLPLFVRTPEGTLETVSAPFGQSPIARRGGSPLSGRRSRAASRRQVPLAPWSSGKTNPAGKAKR